MIIVFVGLLVSVVLVIAVNERVTRPILRVSHRLSHCLDEGGEQRSRGTLGRRAELFRRGDAVSFVDQYNTETGTPNAARIRPSLTFSLSCQFHCCGIDDYRDWSTADMWSGHSFVPDSCCIDVQTDCDKQIRSNVTQPSIYTDVCTRTPSPTRRSHPLRSFKGCLNLIQMKINRNLMVVGILAFVLVFAQV